MVKRPEAKGAERAKKASRASAAVVSTITVIEADNTPSNEMMKLPKAQIIRQMSIPDNKTRFFVDVDNRTKQGKQIIALMDSLREGNTTALKTVTDILGALAGMVAEKAIPRK